MSPFEGWRVGRFVAQVLRWVGRSVAEGRPATHRPAGRPERHHGARLVRRAAVHCPHTGELVTVDLLLGATGSPEVALRCPVWTDQPPVCDQACCKLIEAVTGPALALIVLPGGTDLPDEYEID